MAHKLSTSITFRVHPELRERIWREARAVRLRPTDYLRRRVEDAFGFDPDVCDSLERAPTSLTWRDEDSDDEQDD
jgi:hypothetical protein